MRRVIPFAALALAVCITACGSDLPERLSSTCATETACGYFPDYDACLRGHPLSAYATPLQAVYHRDADERCFEAVRAYGCYQRGVPYPGTACPGAYTGLVPEGGACRGDVECAGGDYCDLSACSTDACCVGACAALPLAMPPDPLGAPCVLGSCVSGAYCDAGRCQPQVTAEDAACDLPDACAPWLSCIAGACRAFGVSGDPCDAAHPCEPSSELCAPDGHCAPNRALGAACDDAHRCVLYAACVDGVCVRSGDDGEPCTNGCYVSLHCAAGVCVPNHPAVSCP